MILDLQFFGGGGAALGRGGASAPAASASENVPDMVGYLSLGMTTTPDGQVVPVSETSTGGRFVSQGGGQWYAENDNGWAASVLQAQTPSGETVYETHFHSRTAAEVRDTRTFSTRTAAQAAGREWLEENR